MCTLRGRHVHYLFISPVCRAATLCISACLAIIMPHALFNARAGSDADSYTAIYLGYAHLLPCLVLSQTAANKCTGPSPAQTCIVFTSGHAPPPQGTHPHIYLFLTAKFIWTSCWRRFVSENKLKKKYGQGNCCSPLTRRK